MCVSWLKLAGVVVGADGTYRKKCVCLGGKLKLDTKKKSDVELIKCYVEILHSFSVQCESFLFARPFARRRQRCQSRLRDRVLSGVHLFEWIFLYAVAQNSGKYLYI